MIVDLFLKVVNLSIGAIPLMAALLVLRMLFKKTVPRKFFYIAWALVFLRLMVPISLESDLSFFNIVPEMTVIEENVGTSVVFVENENERVEFPVFVNPDRENPNVDMPYHSTITGEIVTGPDITTVPMDKNQIYGMVWIFGTVALLLFGIIGYFAVLKKLRFESIEYTDKIRLSEFFKTPVVCGLVRPKIILPMNFDLDDEAKVASVISHECTHIRRGDNLWRLLATFTLYVHWFNPLVWICYNAFIRDMEVSCDEAVLSGAKNDIRTEYAESLVALAGNGTNPLYGGVLSFGECAVKERVKCIMNFKKTTLLIVIICIAAAAALGVIFLTNPSAPAEKEEISYNIVMEEGTETEYSKESGIYVKTIITNTDDKTIWLGPATYIYHSADAETNSCTFAGVCANDGVIMLRPGESAVFSDNIPMDKFNGNYRFTLPDGYYILQREVFLDEALTPTNIYAEYCFEIKAASETIPAEQFYGRVMEGSHLGSFVPDQSNMPTEDVFDDPDQKKYCEKLIDEIKPETVEKFYVTFGPSDETTYREIEYFYMKDILFLLQNMELTVCEMKNPNTGGLTSIYFQTTAGNITIQNNGGFFTIAKENDSVRYAFDAEPCASVFDDIESIARGILSGEFEEGEINPQPGSDDIGKNENPGVENQANIIPRDVEYSVRLFDNNEKTSAFASVVVQEKLLEILKYENFEYLGKTSENQGAIGFYIVPDAVEFIRTEDGRKYQILPYEDGFVIRGSALSEDEQLGVYKAVNEKWDEFVAVMQEEYSAKAPYLPYWFGLVHEKNATEISVQKNGGELQKFYPEDDCFSNFFSLLRNINIASIYKRFDGNTIRTPDSDEYITVKITFKTGTVYEIVAERDYITMVSSDMNYGLKYNLHENTDAYDSFLDYTEEEGPANPMTGKPVIYLYPEKETLVSVNLDFDGKLTYTYPAINDGWKVLAKPDGTLINLADYSTHYYLFWEGFARPEWTYEKGFVVKGSETEKFLRENLAKMGLTPREYNDFITYWVPKMQDNPYNLISFSGDEYSEIAKLTVDPKPDTMIRIHMVWKALDKPIEIEPQVLPIFERKGFVLVEWGGTEIY